MKPSVFAFPFLKVLKWSGSLRILMAHEVLISCLAILSDQGKKYLSDSKIKSKQQNC